MTEFQEMKSSWFFCIILLLLCVPGLLGQLQECTSGEIRLDIRANYSGALQYCYGDEWVNACGRQWTEHNSQVACNSIFNISTTVGGIVTEFNLGEEVNKSVLLNCEGQSEIIDCTTSLHTEQCSTINVTCKGSCLDGRCSCNSGYETFGCEDATCNPQCDNNGRCIFPNECQCSSGWKGDRCRTPICSHNCSNRGSCTGPDMCNCEPGWTQNDCGQALCNPLCENGVCVAPDVCKCSLGWNGTTCSQALCSQECMNGGNCTTPDECTCHEDSWRGHNCTEAVCMPRCTNGGECIAPNNCSCVPGWSGVDCNEAICSNACVNGHCTYPNNCTCDQGWTGPVCSEGICSEPCVNGGNCTAPNTCTCTADWTGSRCKIPVCSEGFCFNGGSCLYLNINCTCTEEWTGSRCKEPICKNACENGGSCDAPNNCSCTDDWRGDICTEAICTEGFCKNNGSCSYPNVKCTCTEDWMGNQCDISICADGFCKNGGECLYPNTNCTCPSQWIGSQCDIAVCSEGFCLNEGNCSYPDVSCSCTEDWEGNQCQTAVCLPSFCKNGGTCLFPNTNCTCSIGWNGDTCNQVDYILLAICLAVFLALLIATSVFICVLVKLHKRWKEKNIRKGFPIVGEVISSPEVNPFLNGAPLRILNPQDKKTQWLQTTDVTSSKVVAVDQDTHDNAEEEMTKPEYPMVEKEFQESEKLITQDSDKSVSNETGDPVKEDVQDYNETIKNIKLELEGVETVKVLQTIIVKPEDPQVKILQEDTEKTDCTSAEESDRKDIQQDLDVSVDIKPLIENEHEESKNNGLLSLPSTSSIPDNKTVQSGYNKLPDITSTASLKKGKTDTTIKQQSGSSDVYAVPIVKKKKPEANKSKIHGTSTEKGNSVDKTELMVCGSEANEGYAIPIVSKGKEKFRTISIKDRRENDIGYENPEASKSAEKQSKRTTSAKKQAATLPTGTVPHQYHVLESVPGLSSPPAVETSVNQYFTLEPPKKTTSPGFKTESKSSMSSRKNKEQQPPVYHTLEPPKTKQVGSCRSTSSASKDDMNMKNNSNEYAIPIGHVPKDSANTSKKNSRVYHVLEKPN